MAVLRLTRFKADPADTQELLARRADLIAAAQAGLARAPPTQLAQVDHETWIDTWRWESLAHAQAAIDHAPSFPEAAAAFSLTRDTTAEFANVVDER